MVVAELGSGIEPQLINLREMAPQIPRNGYLTHGFDCYPAKMIPHMADYLLRIVSKPGDTVLDPFCGSGAILVESSVLGRDAIGVDLNPLAAILARAKTTSYSTQILGHQLEEILCRFGESNCPYEYSFPNASYWFTAATLRKLGIMKAVLDTYLPKLEPDYRFFWLAVMLSIVRESSRADTRGPKPFISKRARERRAGKHFDPFKLFESKARSWVLMEDGYNARLRRQRRKPQINTIIGDSRNLFQILGGRHVDAVVTSPPYLSAQDYYRASKLQLFVLGHSQPNHLLEWARELIGSDRIPCGEVSLSEKLSCSCANELKAELERRSRKHACVFTKYVLDMSAVLREICRVLDTGSQCAIASGYNLISGLVIPTPEVIIELASQQGLCLSARYVDKIRDRWVPTNRNGHNGTIDVEHLLIFKKTRESCPAKT